MHLNAKQIFEAWKEETQSSTSRYEPGPAQGLFLLDGVLDVQKYNIII